MDGRAWIAGFADRLGLEAPSSELIDELLALAGDAAHGSERIAAPIACYLVGRAGVDPAAARRVAATVSDHATGGDQR
jgi:Domain of unknown function (DUF6457)